MERTGLFYARFMDDWIVIAPTKWKLRSAVRIVNATLNVLNIEQHPDKTFIGKVERGFDFLGYFLKPGVLRVSRLTFGRFTERISRLYEQGADYLRIGEYVRNWHRWVRAGIVGWTNMEVKECSNNTYTPQCMKNVGVCIMNQYWLMITQLLSTAFFLVSNKYLRGTPFFYPLEQEVFA